MAFTANITPINAEVEVGRNLMLTPAIDQDLGNVKVQNIVWKSSDTAVATVTDGIVYGVRVGSAEITASYALSDDSSVTATTTITVKEASVVYTVSIDPSVATLKVGGTTTLLAQLDQSLQSGVSVQSTVWSTNNDAVAVVSNGKVTATGEGSVVISVSMNLSNGQATSATAQITVEAEKPAQTQQTKPEQNTNNNQTTTNPPAQQTPSNDNTTSGAYILTNSNTAVVAYDTLKALSDYQLRLARNEIYARHGRKFDDAQLQAYFDTQSWYKGTVAPSAFDAGVLNNTELENIKRIQEVEASR